MANKKSTTTKKGNSKKKNAAAGVAAAVIGAGVAVATAKVLSDKKTRGKIKSKLSSAKKQVMKTAQNIEIKPKSSGTKKQGTGKKTTKKQAKSKN